MGANRVEERLFLAGAERRAESPGPAGAMTARSSGNSRLALVAAHDRASADLASRLLGLAVRILPQAYLDGQFAFTLATGAGQPGPPGRPGPPGGAPGLGADCGRAGQVRPLGTSSRYTAIAVLGLRYLPGRERDAVLGGAGCDDVISLLASRLDRMTSRGDVALVCWAAAEARHKDLPRALARLRALDRLDRWDDQVDVVSAAWVVTALVAARKLCDVEQHLAVARIRLLAARRAIFPHLIGGESSWYRAHVGSFADQVYPVQALARLHGSADDPGALAAAECVADAICRAQGAAGQWWWHYDSRTGRVVEGYPVYSVHQHAMAPMALLELAEAGGHLYLEAICRGLRWLAMPPETRERLIVDEPAMIWRKVARGDRGKVVRGLRAASTRLRPGIRLHGLDLIFRPGTVDHECRPYELGWLLYAWLPRLARVPGLANRAGLAGTARLPGLPGLADS